jgi:hypothetical protein
MWQNELLMRVRLLAKCLLLLTCGLAVCASSMSFDSWPAGNIPERGLPPTSTLIPAELGWYQIPNTKLLGVCPPDNFGNSGYGFPDACKNAIAAWSGGIADTSRNRLVVWGGGHSDYAGNEVYALDLNTLRMERLNNPSVPVATRCAESLTGPAPNSRHTYDGLAYVAHADRMFTFTGSLACSGGGVAQGTWTLGMSALQWQLMNPKGSVPTQNGGFSAADYDPNTKNVFVHTESWGQFASYSYDSNSFKILASGQLINTQVTAVIDPKRKNFYMFGAGQALKIALSGMGSKYSLKTMMATGCNFIGGQAPGAAYDSAQDRIVGWSGGNTVNLYNPDTDSCTSVTYPNGPGAQQETGTFGRFRYFPALGVFALVNDAKQNAFVLRLTEAGSASNVSSANDAKSDADFQARCKAPGVVKCVGWDDPADFFPASGGGGYADGLHPGDDKTIQGTMDTSIKTSGAGSLKFTIRPYTTSNGMGYWRANFGTADHRTKFGPHSTLYLQFRFRVDAEMLKFNWPSVSNEGWKVFIVYGPIPGPSCTGAQFVQENSYQTNIARGYTSCGAPGLYTNNGVPPYLNEQGDYKCSYNGEGNYKAPNCFVYPADIWITEYWIVETGDYGKPNSHFTAYIAAQGQPLKRFIDLPNFSFNGDPDPRDGLETMLLQPYLSGATGKMNNPTAHMWFDELIISTKPIAAPKN